MLTSQLWLRSTELVAGFVSYQPSAIYLVKRLAFRAVILYKFHLSV
jgi:hypothetical protein